MCAVTGPERGRAGRGQSDNSLTSGSATAAADTRYANRAGKWSG